VEQLWFLLEGQEVMGKLVSENLDEAIIQTRFASTSTKDTKLFLDTLNHYIKQHQQKGIQMEACGMPNVYQQMDKSLLNSQLSSLAIAIALVLLLVSLSLKSFKLGIYGIIPILATVLAVFGFMGFTGIALDVATVSVASVALGIGVDYSIHTITAFNYYMKQKKDINSALESTIMTTGKSILINAISVALGFSVLLVSQLVPMQYFGLLIALSMLFSSTGALTLLPVLLIIRNRISEKKRVKLNNNTI
jgi:predicted RND superfamily exporter protein